MSGTAVGTCRKRRSIWCYGLDTEKSNKLGCKRPSSFEVRSNSLKIDNMLHVLLIFMQYMAGLDMEPRSCMAFLVILIHLLRI